MKYVGTYSDPKDIVTKDKLEAVETAIPTKTSQLDNDSGFITSAPVTSVNGATGEVKSTFYVTVTQGDDGSVTADKTAAEVYAAYEAGYAVYAITKFSNIDILLTLPLEAALRFSEMVMLGFALTGATDDTANPSYWNVAYNGSAWLAWDGTLARREDIPTIPTELKNPYSLNIKIGDTTTSYDGSAAKTVEIPKGVPSVTSVNNKTGAVQLNATDVGALPGTTIIPSKTSQLTNDSGFITIGDVPDAPVTSVNGKTGAVALTKNDIGLGNVDNVKQYSASNPPPYPVTSVNDKTGSVNLTASDIGAATADDIYTALNRTNAVDVANSNYTTYMARGEALFSYEVTPTVNGCIAWQYE